MNEEEVAGMAIAGSLFLDLVRGASALAMIFGGVFPFIPQYLTIMRTGNAEGFSLYVCFTLLSANVLRIIFWFGKHFELPLLLQSIVMIVTMLVLVHAGVNAASTKRKFTDSPKRFRDFQLSTFWCWSDFQSYAECVLTLTAVFSVLTYLLALVSPLGIEVVGFLAVFIEACLGVPQFYRNYQKRSTAGMSVAMVAMWTSGDLFKTGYFYLRDAPAQFFLCGALQIMVDIAILLQIFLYARHDVHVPASTAREKQLPRGVV